MAAIQARKSLLRKQIKSILAALSAHEKKRQSDIVCEKLINLATFKNSQRISIYLSTANEISTEGIIRKIFELNKTCYIPRYYGDVMQMVKLDSMEDWSTLPLTKWNIKQPSVKEYREDALETGGFDLIIVPGVAFTQSGARMGHGKGYYDSYMSNVFKMQDKPPATIAVAFKEQICDDIPLHEHDVLLDSVIFAN